MIHKQYSRWSNVVNILSTTVYMDADPTGAPGPYSQFLVESESFIYFFSYLCVFGFGSSCLMFVFVCFPDVVCTLGFLSYEWRIQLRLPLSYFNENSNFIMLDKLISRSYFSSAALKPKKHSTPNYSKMLTSQSHSRGHRRDLCNTCKEAWVF